MRAFVTGATGFIGGHVARLLRERGDEVVALVRTPGKAAALERLGCQLGIARGGDPRLPSQPGRAHPPLRRSDGVTLWMSDQKARRELGLRTRDPGTGLRQTLAAEGRIAAAA
jgi:thioester reductase-like protein